MYNVELLRSGNMHKTVWRSAESSWDVEWSWVYWPATSQTKYTSRGIDL